MEVNNSIFSTDEILGEIIYTFDVPAQPNDKIFEFAHFVYVQKKKKYEAEILVGGAQIAKGDLYIQKAAKNIYSLGLVVNSFSKKWTEMLLTEADFGKIEISNNSDEHKNKWMSFIRSTIIENSDIKFPLFYNEKLYTDGGNSDFGKDAALTGNNNDEMFFVNRFFFDKTNGMAFITDGPWGIKMFNDSRSQNPNTYTFAPAFRLVYLLNLLFKTNAFKLIGNYYNIIKNIFVQSLFCLDASQNQYDETNTGNLVITNKSLSIATNFYEEDFLELYAKFKFNSNFEYLLRSSITQNIRFIITLNNQYNVNELSETYDSATRIRTKEYLMLTWVNRTDSRPLVLPNYIADVYTQGTIEERFGIMVGGNWIPWGNKVILIDKDNVGNFIENLLFKFDFTDTFLENRYYALLFCKAEITIFEDMLYVGSVKYHNINQYYNSDVSLYNMFSRNIEIAKCLPSTPVSTFINEIVKTLGLSIMIDSQKKEIEIESINEILNSHNYIDLNRFLLTNETSVDNSILDSYSFAFSAIEENEVNDYITVQNYEALPDAKVHLGKIVFVKNQNIFYRSIQRGDSALNWIYNWEFYSGNTIKKTIGEENITEIKSESKIPSLRCCNRASKADDLIPEINAPGISRMFSTGNENMDLILVNYCGSKKLNNYPYYEFEFASPINYGKRGYDLTSTGENSVGENLIAPWLTLLSNHEIITHRFLFDLKTFLEVWLLLKPQDKPVSQQTRWVMVESVKLLPKKMTFEFTEGKEYILAEIELAKPVVKI